MSEVKHTPGPWNKIELRNGARVTAKSGKLNKYVASVFNDQTWVDEWEANAKLIAAAPELLGLIQWITRVTNNPEIGIKCDAAIKKATT